MIDLTRVDKYTLCFACISIFIAIISLATVPPITKDALTHHLAVPKIYLQHGGIFEIPDKVFSYYPMNLDLFYLVPLYLGNDFLPKYIHFFFGILTAGVVHGYLKRRIDQTYALGSALFFFSIPIIVKLSISVYVDLGLVFFTTAALLLLMKWGEHVEKKKFLVFSAIFCGLAMGTKYNGLVGFVILAAFVPFVYMRRTVNDKVAGYKAFGYVLMYTLVALAIFSPWMIRDYIWTGNPIYPLYDQWFNPGAVVSKSTFGIFTERAVRYHESLWEMVLLPVRIFFQGQDGSPQLFDGRLNPFLLILPFFAFLRSQNDSKHVRFEKIILLTFAVLFFTFSFFSTGLRIRYILPIVPPLVILSVYGAKNITEWIKRIRPANWKRLITGLFFAIIAIAFWLNAGYIYHQFKIVKPFEYLSGKITRDQYIERYRLEYPAMKYMNRNLPENAKVMFFYIGNRGYYCDREYVFDMINYKSTLYKIVKQADNPETVYKKLKQKGITHFLIREDIFKRWVSEDFSEKEKDVLKRFFGKYVKRLYIKNGYGVFHLSVLGKNLNK